MFEPTSRYYTLEIAVHTMPDGHIVAYKRRRFLPRGEELDLLAEVAVTEGDRLDLIASRALGNAEFFWWICDANDAMNPFDLGEEINRRLRVPVP
jgi:hypothetical protein